MTTLFDIAGREARIHALHGRVPFMLAADLAKSYAVKTEAVGQAVKRNPERFPEDFAFRLTEAETEHLKSQIVISSVANRAMPLAFTHAGALALSGVLRSSVAARVSVAIHRAFAAMEAKAMADARFLLAKLRNDMLVRTPIYARVQMAEQQGWSLDQTWRAYNYPRHKIEQAARELLAMHIIDRPLAGMQVDLFSEG